MKPFLFIFFSIIGVFGCKENSTNRNDTKKISVTDFRGKEVTISKPALRIVCLMESAMSGIYMLQQEDKIVGVPLSVYNESNAKFYAALDDRIKSKKLTAAGNWDFINIETILSLQPDIVILWASQQEAIDAIEQHDIPVYAVMIKCIDDIYKEIMDFGILTGAAARADSLISYTKQEVNSSALNISVKPKVYFTWPQGLLETAGSKSIVQQVFDAAGVHNICQDSVEHAVMSMENLVTANPDYIVSWYSEQNRVNEILFSTQLATTNAIRNGKVFQIPSSFWCDLWTLKFPLAIKFIANSCHANLDTNFDWRKAKKEMAKQLYGSKANSIIEME